MMPDNTLKIKTENELRSHIYDLKSEKLRIGLLCGCFDIPHIGHVRLFEFAKTKVDKLIVGLDHDHAVSKSKGEHRPIHSQKLRMEMLAALSCIDYVFPLGFKGKFGNTNSFIFWKALLKSLHPDAIFTCPEADIYSDPKKQIANDLKIEFHEHSIHFGVSTTKIEKIFMEGY